MKTALIAGIGILALILIEKHKQQPQATITLPGLSIANQSGEVTGYIGNAVTDITGVVGATKSIISSINSFTQSADTASGSPDANSLSAFDSGFFG